MQHCQIRVRSIRFYHLWSDVKLGLNFVHSLFSEYVIWSFFHLCGTKKLCIFARFTPNKLDLLELNVMLMVGIAAWSISIKCSHAKFFPCRTMSRHQGKKICVQDALEFVLNGNDSDV